MEDKEGSYDLDGKIGDISGDALSYKLRTGTFFRRFIRLFENGKGYCCEVGFPLQVPGSRQKHLILECSFEPEALMMGIYAFITHSLSEFGGRGPTLNFIPAEAM